MLKLMALFSSLVVNNTGGGGTILSSLFPSILGEVHHSDAATLRVYYLSLELKTVVLHMSQL